MAVKPKFRGLWVFIRATQVPVSQELSHAVTYCRRLAIQRVFLYGVGLAVVIAIGWSIVPAAIQLRMGFFNCNLLPSAPRLPS